MSTITIQATDNVPPEVVAPIRDALQAHVQVEKHRIGLKSLEKESLIALVGSLDAWQLLVAGAAGLYLKEILKEAAKEHWRNKSKIFNAVKNSVVKPIRDLAAAITRSKATSTPSANVTLVLAWPDDVWGTRFFLAGNDQEAVTVELVAFLANTERIQATLQALETDEVRPMPPIQVHLLADGTLELRFVDENDETERSVRLPPNAA